MMKANILVLALLVFLLIPLVSAQQGTGDTIQIIQTEGGDIEFLMPQIISHKQGENYTFDFTAINAFNQTVLTSNGSSCDGRLTSVDGLNGKFIYTENNLTYNEDTESWQMFVSKGNFTHLGEYTFSAFCRDQTEAQKNDATHVGSASTHIEVTNTGDHFTFADGFSMSTILLSAVAVSFLFSFIGFQFKNNPRFTWLSFLFIVIALMLAIYAFYLGFVFAEDIVSYASLSELQEVMFTTLLWLMVGLAIISAAVMLIAFIRELGNTFTTQKFGEGFDPITDTYE